jgi:DHA3 family macrolide efflux protein-like MFS transporter
MGTLPMVVIAPFAGVVVDRFNRRFIMMASDGLVALFTLVLAVLFWAGVAEPWHMLAAVFLRATAGAFQFPAMQASTSLMVPAEQLARVQGFNQMLQGVMGIIAPPVGALLLGVLPLQGVLAIDLVTALLGIAPLFFIAIPQPPQSATAAQASFLSEMRDGMIYMVRWRGLFIIGLMAIALNFLLSPAAALLPLLVTQHFGGQEGELAAISSAFSLGMLVGGILLGLGFGAVGFIPANGFWVAVVVWFISAAANVITNGPLLAAMQIIVRPEMQGRVFSLLGSLATAMAPVGLLIAGPLADAIGVRTWYIVGGAVCVVMAVVALFIPDVRHLEDHKDEVAPPITAAEPVSA